MPKCILGWMGLWLACALFEPSAAAQGVEIDYFDPPITPSNTKVEVHGTGMESVTAVYTFNIYGSVSSEFQVLSNEALEITTPKVRYQALGTGEFSVLIENEQEVLVAVPYDYQQRQHGGQPVYLVPPTVKVEDIRNFRGTVVYLQEDAWCSVGPNEAPFGQQPSSGMIIVAETGSTVDISANPDLLVYHEPDTTIIGKGNNLHPIPNVRLERVIDFIAHDRTPETQPLSTPSEGNGSVIRNPDKDLYYIGERVRLTAAPAEGSAFVAWAGFGGGGSDPVTTITMDFKRELTARFTTGHLLMVDTPYGEATIKPSLPLYPSGTTVSVKYEPQLGHSFAAWAGDQESDKNPFSFIISEDTSISATISSPPQRKPKWTFEPFLDHLSPNQMADRWTLPAIGLDGTIYTGYHGTRTNGPVFSTANLGQEQLDLEGTFFALNPDGTQKWRKTMMFPSITWVETFGFSHPLLDSEDNLYLGAGESVHRLSNEDGAIQWQRSYPDNGFNRVNGITGLALSRLDVLHPAFGGFRAVDPGIIALNLDGSTRWQSDLLPAANTVCINLAGDLLVNGADLFALNSSTASQTYHLERSPGGNPVLDRQGNVYLQDLRSGLKVLLPNSDRLVTLYEWGACTSPVFANNGIAYITTANNELIAFDQNFQESWTQSGVAYQSPVIADDGTIYVLGDQPGYPTLYAVNPDSSIAWIGTGIVDTNPGEQDSPITIGRDGSVYVASQNATFYAFPGGAELARRSAWPKPRGDYDNTARVKGVPPAILAQATDQEVPLDLQIFRLHMTVASDPLPTAHWFRDGQAIGSPDKFHSSGDQYTWSWNLVTGEFLSGDYVVELTNAFGTVSSEPISVTTNAYFKPRILGAGEVIFDPDRRIYRGGEEVTITAIPDANHEFLGWEGALSGTENPITIKIDRIMPFTAAFGDQTSPSITLNKLPDTSATRTIAISGVIEDLVGLDTVTWAVNDGSFTSLSIKDSITLRIPKVPLRIGENEIIVVATDTAGNTERATQTIHYIPEQILSLAESFEVPEGHAIRMPLALTSTGNVGSAAFELHYDPIFWHNPSFEFEDSIAQSFHQIKATKPGIIEASFTLPATTVAEGESILGWITGRARSVPSDTPSLVNLLVNGASGREGAPLPTDTEGLAGTLLIQSREVTGDINNNGELDSGDAHLALRLLTQLDEARGWDVPINDLNDNQQLESGDVVKILRTVAEIDPQPIPITPSSISPRPRLTLASVSGPVAPGDTVTIQVNLTAGDATPGMKWVLDYPAKALRLEGMQSLTTDALVPKGSLALWNVWPSQDDFSQQTGTLVFASGHTEPWPGSELGGRVASLTFTVQEAASSQADWTLQLRGGHFSSADGYTLQHLTPDTLTLAVQTLTPFEIWSQEIPAEKQRSLLADPDGDALTNAQEYFFATDPNTPTWSHPIRLDRDHEDITLRFDRRLKVGEEISFAVERSSDLAIWQTVDADTMEQVLTGNQQEDRESVTLTLKDSTDLKGYLRIQLSPLVPKE